MPVFGAVDIGANSVRLKIARLTKGRLHTLAEDREVTRLGESVFLRGNLSSDAISHTVQVLKRFHRTAQAHGAESVRVVATSALRDAGNSRAFLDWVYSATGWQAEVISGLEEGRLIHLALMSSVPQARNARCLLFDLGGGSCEITVSDAGQIRHMASVPLGAVRLTREFLKTDPPNKDELLRMRRFIGEELERLERRVLAAKIQLAIATSGTAAALAGVHTSRRESRPTTVPAPVVATLVSKLAKFTAAQRSKLPGIGTRRAEIIVAGAAVFSEILHRFELPSFRYSPLGLRDGLLAQMAADYDRGTQFQKRIETERRTALMDVGRQYGVNLQHAERIRDLSLELFDSMVHVHNLPADYREWLGAAAMLQEVGAYVNRAGRHRHTYYLISHSEIYGYTTMQRQIIAAIARYVGKSHPSPEARPVRVLNPLDQSHVAKAVVLLRLARALEQSRRGAVKSFAVHSQAGKVQLTVEPNRGGADLELWAVQKERAYFRAIFGRELLAAVS
jgi:exopolyphosphatase / guanosine-5'-triphosphate,3'-diphosphate pyrophosphatase